MTPISIRHILTVYALLLSTLLAGAQVIDTDTVQSRYRVAATMFGIGRQKALDTYLSPFQYAGPEASFLRSGSQFPARDHASHPLRPPVVGAESVPRLRCHARQVRL